MPLGPQQLKLADRQTGRQADGQTGRRADRQTDRQTGRQTDRHTGRQSPREEAEHHGPQLSGERTVHLFLFPGRMSFTSPDSPDTGRA